MRVAVYARVSTERQGRDQTIESQLDALRGWAAGHGHELKREHVYIDEGFSGSRLDRPALDRLRDAAREGEFDAVGVYSPDRLARRYAYQVVLLEELRKAGCPVEFVHRPISDDPHDQLLLQIQGAVAEYERAMLGERFRRGKLQKARAGHWVAGQAPYGYRYVPARDGVPAHLEVDDAEAAVVRQLHRWLIDERMTVRQILKRLAAGPVRPRSGKRLWSTSVVYRILSDPVYAGTGYANRHIFVVPRKPRSTGPRAGTPTCRQPRPREEWIPIRVPAIIDESTHQDSQSQLARNSALSFRNNTRNDYLLRCLLTCRTCGLAMFGITTHDGSTSQREHRYYKCHGKDTVARDRECRCTQTPAKADELDAAVWGHVKGLLEDPAALATRFEELARLSEAKDGGKAAVQRWEAQIQRLGREEQRLVDAYQAEVIDLAELKSRREQIRGRRRVLVTQRDQEQRLQAERQAAKAVWSDLEAFCRRVRSRLDEATLAERQRVLQLLIERVIVGEDSLEIRHVIPLGRTGGEPSHQAPGETSGPGGAGMLGPEETPGDRPNCRLRSDGVTPADLPAGRGDPVVGTPAVGHRDRPVLGPQDRLGDLGAAVAGDGEDGKHRRHRRPQPGLVPVFAPGGLVGVHHLGRVDRRGQLVVRGRQRRGRVPLQLGNHPRGDRQPEQVADQLLDLPLAQSVGPGQRGQDGLQVGAEAHRGDARGQGAASGLPAVRAREAVQPIFVHDRFDLRQFGDLMDQRVGVLAGQRMTAAPTGGGLAVLRGAELLGRDQGTERLAMAGLSAALSPGRRAGRLSLQTDRVGRRGLGRVGGVELEAGLEVTHGGFQRSDPILHLLPGSQKSGLGLGRDGVPERFGDWKLLAHTHEYELTVQKVRGV
jgi:site-specific DNA recombinase